MTLTRKRNENYCVNETKEEEVDIKVMYVIRYRYAKDMVL